MESPGDPRTEPALRRAPAARVRRSRVLGRNVGSSSRSRDPAAKRNPALHPRSLLCQRKLLAAAREARAAPARFRERNGRPAEHDPRADPLAERILPRKADSRMRLWRGSGHRSPARARRQRRLRGSHRRRHVPANVGDHPNCRVVQASIDDLPFKEPAFDIVWCHRVLQHTPSPARTLAHILGFARDDGAVFVHSYARTFHQMSAGSTRSGRSRSG
jgi:hypothetical protein